jgi:formiminoglutamase
VDGLCTLTEEEIAADGDVGAAEIYQVAQDVEAYVLADVARAIVDLNRAEDDRRKDGVVKTHTCWDVPVYRQPLSEDLIQTLLERYHRPYHRRLTELGRSGRFRVGVDCHTMAAHGPPVGPDPGIERPWVCVGDGDGACPQSWVRALADRFREALGGHVSINVPFRGGYIVRAHGSEMPWLQLELSRAPFRSSQEKRMAVLQALRRWCELDLAGAV